MEFLELSPLEAALLRIFHGLYSARGFPRLKGFVSEGDRIPALVASWIWMSLHTRNSKMDTWTIVVSSSRWKEFHTA